MAKYICKHCETTTNNSSRVCSDCNEKLRLWRQIRAMLMPYKISKEEREKQYNLERGRTDGRICGN